MTTYCDMLDRMKRARGLVQNGQARKALPEYLFLWQNMTTPETWRARRTFLAADMAAMFRADPNTCYAFVTIRDSLDPMTAAFRSDDDIGDWLTLNAILPGPNQTLVWAEQMARRHEFEHLQAQLRERVLGVLIANERFVEAGRLIGSPMEYLAHEYEQHVQFKEEVRRRWTARHRVDLIPNLLRYADKKMRRTGERLLQILAAGGRGKEIEDVRAELGRLGLK
jgi:hypothetical protein